MDDARIKTLKDEKVSKAIIKLSIPAIIGMLVMAIYNFVDAVFVSWYDVSAPGALQVVMPVMLIASAIGLSLGIGGASYISRLLGAHKKDRAEQVVSLVFITGIILGVLSTIFNYIFMDKIFSIFATDQANMNMIKNYGTYIIYGYTFMILNMILNNILRSEGSVKYSMIAMISGSILNIILDPIFIFVFDWGVEGAAIATTLSNMFSFVILLFIFLNKKTILHLKIKNMKFDLSIYKEVLIVGLPILFRQFLFSLSMGLLNYAAKQYGGGNELISVIGNMLRTVTIPSYIIFGFGQALQPVAGYNYGAKNPQRVMESFKFTAKITSIIMIITAIIFGLFGSYVIRIFNMSDTMIDYAIKGFRYLSIGLIFLGFTNSVTVFFQALGKGFKALLMSISRQGFFFIPAILILPKILGIDGVLAAQGLSDILSAILAFILFIPYIKTSKIEKLIYKTT